MDGLRPGWAVKVIIVIIITSILFRCVSATNHSVGGSIGWDLASDLRAWSASTTFHVGDSLVFAYTPLHDVLEVNESDFDSCQISHPIHAHRDGNTVIQLSQTGSRYFICGRLGHCDMGLKLQVQVLPQLSTNATHAGSDGNGNGNSNGSSRKRPPAPQGHESPAPPSNRSREKPDPLGQPSVPVPPATSPSKASGACHVEAAGSLITLLLIISSWPRQTLRFMFTFLHLVI